MLTRITKAAVSMLLGAIAAMAVITVLLTCVLIGALMEALA